jgi:hypothetical protein
VRALLDTHVWVWTQEQPEPIEVIVPQAVVAVARQNLGHDLHQRKVERAVSHHTPTRSMR